jgi:hypothetical protein
VSVRLKLVGFAAIIVATFSIAYVVGTHAPVLW